MGLADIRSCVVGLAAVTLVLIMAACTSSEDPSNAEGRPEEQDRGSVDDQSANPAAKGRIGSMEVSLDPDGRPYEVIHGYPSTAKREPLTRLFIPDGEMAVMDGNYIQTDPAAFSDQATAITVEPEAVDENGVHEINIDVIWEQFDGFESVLGIWVGPSDAKVTAWDRFEYGYGTDGGVGGIVSAEVLARPLLPNYTYWVDDPDFSAKFNIFDLDGTPGDETFIFANGWRDGGFPLIRGRDADGTVVAVVIWRTNFPWRLGVPEGTPPPTVTEREQNLIECMEGTRAVRPDGICDFDTDEW